MSLGEDRSITFVARRYEQRTHVIAASDRLETTVRSHHVGQLDELRVGRVSAERKAAAD